ncbi:MAG: thioredoxin family protein [Spirochaetota bacterium]
MHRTRRFLARIATPTLILIALLLAPAAASAEVWLDSYDEGLAAAKESERPLVLFITAPGWCEPCDRFEAEVLSDDLVGDILRKEFVTVRLTDRDPEHARFEFPGYPSFLVFHPAGDRLGAFHAPDTSRELRAELEQYQRPLDELPAEADRGTEAATEAETEAETEAATEDSADAGGTAYRYPGGVFVRRENGSWVREADGERTTFSEYREDDRYAYLKPSDGEDADGSSADGSAADGSAAGEGFFAIPKDGGRAFRWNADREAWESAWQVTAPDGD